MTETAAVYGSALYDLAREQQQEAQYLSQVLLIRQLVQETPAFLQLLSARSVPLEERRQVVERCFGDCRPELKSYLKLLCDRNIIRQLPDCLRQFELCYNRDHGIVEVTATSAVPLTPPQAEALQKKLEARTGKSVRLRFAVDPTVLGGMRLSLEGQELDGTLRRRLEVLSGELRQLTL